MSRLIVKNIPAYVTPERLKEHFSRKNGPGGFLTDVKVALKSDGTSRRFGFIGYKDEQEALRAQQWYDKTFIGTTRINVAVAEKGAKEAPTPRPNKRPRLDPVDLNRDTHNTKHSSKGKEKESEKEDKHLKEYLDVMKAGSKKGPSWANEIAVDHISSSPTAGPSKVVENEGNVSDNIGEEWKGFSSPTEPSQTQPEQAEEVDDLEWMRRRMKGINTSEDVEEGPSQQTNKDETEIQVSNSFSEQSPQESPTDIILRTARLFLRNLAFSCQDADLQTLFSSYGSVEQVHIPLDPVTKASKGLAFVRFAQPASALAAYEALDKTPFQGRLLHILPAVDRNGLSGSLEEGKMDHKGSVKEEKKKKLKVDAGRDFNWSMLYMNSDAVASSVADRMNIKKSDILNPEDEAAGSASAAVKLALAETHIIQETKTYLESEGINLSAFSTSSHTSTGPRPRRSDTCILVKNIPYGTTVDQIREMFAAFGELTRILVPPAGTLAVVDFVHPDEASKGFKGVAYRRLGSSVIYLEKAPMGLFVSSANRSTTVEQSRVKPVTIPEQELENPEFVDLNSASGSTLFVKNLSFATTTNRLTQVFRHLPSFSFARVQTKPDPKAPPGVNAPRLSMGYGFVGFKSADAAKKALSSIQSFVLDGHVLHVKFAGRGTETESKDKVDASSRTTKMIVKNVPFEASKKDIRDLFGSHGQLKSVRLPKKFNSRSRGFAFLDFVTRHEAENAYASLRHTHLLGRHLVLEWAEDAGADVDALRQKAGVGYGDGGELPSRKRKLDMGGEEDGGDES